MFIDPSGNKRTTYDLGKGWYADIDSADTNTKTQRHVHLYKGRKNWSQNEDGSPHDKNGNSPGSPPNNVLERLKEKTGWNWNDNLDEFAKTVDIQVFIVKGGMPTTYATLTYKDGTQITMMHLDAMVEDGITSKEIWESYYNAVAPEGVKETQLQPRIQGPFFTPILSPLPMPAPMPFPAPFGFPAFGF